jgi:hypothetical protein
MPLWKRFSDAAGHRSEALPSRPPGECRPRPWTDDVIVDDHFCDTNEAICIEAFRAKYIELLRLARSHELAEPVGGCARELLRRDPDEIAVDTTRLASEPGIERGVAHAVMQALVELADREISRQPNCEATLGQHDG